MLQFIVVGLFMQKVGSLLPVSLLQNYDKRVAPYDLQNETLVVNISLPLLNLMVVHGQEQMATLIFETKVEWYDDRLKYNPVDFNNRHELYLPKDEIWIAHYSLLNAVESKLLTNKRGDTAFVAPNGRIVIREMYYAKVGCYARIQRFPFDAQYCTVALGDTITNTSTVAFSGKLFPNAEIYANGEFYMQNFSVLSVKRGQKNLPSKVIFAVTFERETFYFVFVIVIPTMLITSFTIAGALLPASGEQAADPINIGLASLLALSITMTIIANDIPKTSVVPLIGWFVLICLAICTFAVVSGLIFDRIRIKGRAGELPGICRKLIFSHKTAKESKIRFEKLIGMISLLFFLLFQLFLFINSIVFFSFSWNKDPYSKIDDMDATDAFDLIFTTTFIFDE